MINSVLFRKYKGVFNNWQTTKIELLAVWIPPFLHLIWIICSGCEQEILRHFSPALIQELRKEKENSDLFSRFQLP